MAEELLNQVRDAVEGQIDFEGQKVVDQTNTYALSIIGVIAFLVGYFTQNITYTLYAGLGGTAITALALIPPWPVFNKHPEKWLPSQDELSRLNIKIN